MPYAQTVLSHLEKNGVRARISDARFSLAKRIRNAEMQKTPFMIVLGDEERANNTVNFRSYALKTQETLSLEEVCGKIE
jgi:threonyl-tRNA synthetase